MNKIVSTFTIIIGLIGLTSLTGCTTTGAGGSAQITTVVRVGAQYMATKELGKAKNLTAWQSRHAKLTTVAAALKTADTGLTPEAFRAILAAKFGSDPEKLLILDLLLSLAPPTAATTGLNNDFLKAATAGLEAALLAPPPTFAILQK